MRTSLHMSILLLAFAGCRTVTVDQPLTDSLGGNDPKTQMDFWHTLAERRITSNDEAFHGLLLFLDEQDPAESYRQRVEILKRRGLLSQDFDRPANEAVHRGTLAVAVVRALELEGGLMLRLSPHSPRYSTRELEHLDIFPVSSPNQTFSGLQFLGVLGRVEDFQRGAVNAANTWPGQAPP